MTVQGHCLLLLLLQVLVASLGASVLPSSSSSSSSSSAPHDGSRFFFGDSGTQAESHGWTYPEFKEPTEKEWIEMISGILSENGSPSNLTVHGEQTGAFNNSDGVKGTFKGKSIALYKFGDRTRVTSAMATMTVVDHQRFAKGVIRGSLCSNTPGNETVCSNVQLGFSFRVKANDTYVQTGSSLSFSESVYIRFNQTDGGFLYNGLSLANSSDSYSIRQTQAIELVTLEKHAATINGTVTSASTPLSIAQGKMGALPRDRFSLAWLLVSSRDSSGLWGSTTTFESCYKFGKKTSFDSVAQTEVSSLKSNLHSTSTVHGDYTVGNDHEDHPLFLLHDFLNAQDY